MKHLYNYPGTLKIFTHVKSAALGIVAVILGLGAAAQPAPSATRTVSLISFNAGMNNASSVMLSWATASQVQASHFVIQRSVNGNDFDDKAIVFTGDNNGATGNQFDYADNIRNIQEPVLYYRLKAVDMEGRSNYSSVAVIRSGKTDGDTSVTDATISQLRVVLPVDWQNKKVQFKVYNAAGMLIKEQYNSNAEDVQAFSIANLKTGIYTIEAIHGKEIVTQKVLKILSPTL